MIQENCLNFDQIANLANLYTEIDNRGESYYVFISKGLVGLVGASEVSLLNNHLEGFEIIHTPQESRSLEACHG